MKRFFSKKTDVLIVPHQISNDDEVLIEAFENQMIQLVEFNHATHIKLAYSYLVLYGMDVSIKKYHQVWSNSLKPKA